MSLIFSAGLGLLLIFLYYFFVVRNDGAPQGRSSAIVSASGSSERFSNFCAFLIPYLYVSDGGSI